MQLRRADTRIFQSIMVVACLCAPAAAACACAPGAALIPVAIAPTSLAATLATAFYLVVVANPVASLVAFAGVGVLAASNIRINVNAATDLDRSPTGYSKPGELCLTLSPSTRLTCTV